MTDKQVWSVNWWGSHPDEGNDDRWSGQDFNTEAEARACFDAYTGCPVALKAERERQVLDHGEKTWEHWINDLARTTPYAELSASGCKDTWSSENTLEVGEVWCYLPKADTHTDDDYERMYQSEAAMQAGMAFGVDGYNDAMGFSLDHGAWD